MRKTSLAITLTIFLALTSTACSEQSSSQANQSDPDLTGKRFFDAAASKFMAANPNIARKQANCMVTEMTADGKIGLGEINQMKLDETGLHGASRLESAHSMAMKKCVTN